MLIKHLLLLLFISISFSCTDVKANKPVVLPGAYQMDEYLPLLEGKSVGLFVNHTALINDTHLADSLIDRGITITSVFTPEHGFKGNYSDGEKIEQENIKKSFELISLYGKHKKPTQEQVEALDVLVIDIQEVGVRFYTYSSTMTYLMEACAKYGVPVLILDRPNPNGSYVDGPVLNTELSSFVGLHPIPIVHGLTLGELAYMINEEGWLSGGLRCDLEIVKVRNWTHNDFYALPVKPSPNLPNDLSVALYPSLALFEGTIVSIGRGTEKQFQIVGHPSYPDSGFTFTPQPNEGSKHPPLQGEKCFGIDLSGSTIQYEFSLKYLLQFYEQLNGKTEKPFFNAYFKKLAGTDELKEQIEAGMSEKEIRQTWQADLKIYEGIRSKYLLYK
ncbi:MAG: DUF1343 domain-containing protein [Cyclobacteriaceae bacterium]